jgi:hypothetical protein
VIVIEYRIHGYMLSDALRPDPKYGKRTFFVDETLPVFEGWTDQDFIDGSIETAPERYSLATVQRVGSDEFIYDARKRFPMTNPDAEAKE